MITLIKGSYSSWPIILLLIASISLSSAASTIYVNGFSGDDSNNGTSWQSAKKTIQNAIDTVDSAGEVNVADGLYTEQINFNKNVNLIGESGEQTIIDGADNGLPVYVYVANVCLINFTIQNGSGDSGGGIYNNSGTLTLKNCTIIQNKAVKGGAVFNNLGTINILDSCIKDNYASEYGGGIHNKDILVLTNCNLVQNTASTKYGGGIYSNQGKMILNNCNIENNMAIYCGGIYSHQDINVKINNSKFKGNTSTTNSGGGLLNYYSNITLRNVSYWQTRLMTMTGAF